MQELRLTVALELNDLDHKILEYTRFVCQSLPITKIYVLHVEERLDLPESMLAKHPELENAPFDETLEQQMKDKVEQFLDTEKLIIDYDVLEGKVMETLVKQTHLKHSDLLIVGNRHQPGENEVVSAKLARRAPCSVLFVPEEFSLDIQNVLVPIDFSEHAALAAQMALSLSSAVNGDTVHFLNVYKVPQGYYRLGETYEEACDNMRYYAQEDYSKFVAKLQNVEDNTVEVHFEPKKDGPVTQTIIQQIKDLNCQLLVMGSKGRTNLSAIFMGSLTEKLIQANLGVPMLVVKKKDENLNFLEALLEISGV